VGLTRRPGVRYTSCPSTPGRPEVGRSPGRPSPAEDPHVTTRTLIARLFAAVTAAAALGGTARAGLVPSVVTVTPDAGNFRWTYAVVLPTDMKLQAGSYFTVYDFGGLVAGSATAPDGWSVSAGNAGPVPAGLHPNDDPAIVNLTFTYHGPVVPSGQVGLG